MKAMNRCVLFVSALLVSFAGLAATDPTTPLGSPASSQRETRVRTVLPRLEAILCSGNACSAVINGRAVRKGQSIHGYVVSAIREDVVTLRRGERRWLLTVFEDQVVL